MTRSKPRRAVWLERIDALPVPHTVLIAISFGILVIDADLITGAEISFSVFYVAPTALVVWRLGRRPGYVSAVLAASAWYVVEVVSDQEYSNALIPVWNGLVRLAFFVIIATLLSTLRDALREQSEQARVDPLTGVLNRRGFTERADVEIERAERSSRPFTIATFDIDDFKQLNDTAGHAAGDEVLRQVGEHMTAALRHVDVIGRLGGDEFAVVLPETDGATAIRVLERLDGRLRAATAGSGVGFSFGAVTYSRPPGSADEALECADTLMYSAKAERRGAIRHRVEPSVPTDMAREPAPS